MEDYIELPGRPNIVYQLKDYTPLPDGVQQAREEVPFLFKAFEVGQTRPPAVKNDETGMGAMMYAPRAATIHEFLDWTVSGVVPIEARRSVRFTQDFWGFRMIMIYARNRPMYPPPRTYDVEVPCVEPRLAAPSPSLPILIPRGKPLTAATIRCGPNYLEVPFFATVDHRRGQGFGRILLEVIEEIARAIGVSLIMLCSENHQNTWGVWEHLGFKKTTRGEFASFGIHQEELLHMDNTVQMHKFIAPPKVWRSIKIKHNTFVQRSFYYKPPDPSNMFIDRVASSLVPSKTGVVKGATKSNGRGGGGG